MINIKRLLLILLISLFIFYCYNIFYKGKKIVDKGDKDKKDIIHSPKLNKGFFIDGSNKDELSKIQLSLNKRDNIYHIKGTNLYKNNILLKELNNIC